MLLVEGSRLAAAVFFLPLPKPAKPANLQRLRSL